MPGRPDWIGLYLEEDLGPGDITADALFAPTAPGRARIVAREGAFLAGTGHAIEVFQRCGVRAERVAPEATWLEAGAEVLRMEGPCRGILAGERLALNIIARMSAIAGATRELADQLQGTRAQVAGTRKTTPGFRAFEKEAIRAGGGDGHRMGLFDEAMVKDNHLAALGGDVAQAVRRVRAANPGRTVTCEAERLEDALAAAAAGADWVLIDNQDPDTGQAWAEALRRSHPHIKVEASGGIRPANARAYGWADRVSMGWLTQAVPAKDFSLEWTHP